MNIPEIEVLYHEAGHMVMGLHLGIREHNLQFTSLAPGERGQAHHSRLGASKRALVMRSLAGFLVQIRFAPDSVTPEFAAAVRRSLIEAAQEPKLPNRECLLDARCDLKIARTYATEEVGCDEIKVKNFLMRCERSVN